MCVCFFLYFVGLCGYYQYGLDFDLRWDDWVMTISQSTHQRIWFLKSPFWFRGNLIPSYIRPSVGYQWKPDQILKSWCEQTWPGYFFPLSSHKFVILDLGSYCYTGLQCMTCLSRMNQIIIDAGSFCFATFEDCTAAACGNISVD